MKCTFENGDRDFSEYDKMTNQELEDILRAHVLIEDEFEDDELLAHILEVVTQRDIINLEANLPGPEESWKNFEENHPLLFAKEVGNQLHEVENNSPKKRNNKWLMRRVASIAAVISCVVVLGSVTA